MSGYQPERRAGGRQTRPLRYAVLFTRDSYALWHELCLTALLRVEDAHPVLLIHGDKSGLEGRPRLARGGKLWRLLLRIEQRLHPSQVWQPRPLTAAIATLPKMDCALALHDAHAYRFADADVAAIRAHDLDFILGFPGYDILRGAILDAARHGVWAYHYADPARFRGAPPGVWEIHDRAPTTGIMLQRLTDRLDTGVLLRQGETPTVGHSFNRNLDTACFAAADFPAQVCRDLLAGDETRLEAPPLETAAAIRRAPDNLQALRLAAILLGSALLRALRAGRTIREP